MKTKKPVRALGSSKCKECGEKIEAHAGIPAADLQAQHEGFCSNECKERDDDA